MKVLPKASQAKVTKIAIAKSTIAKRLATEVTTEAKSHSNLGYCPQTAGQLAELAHVAYHESDSIAQRCQQLGLPQFSFFHQGNTQAFLTGNEQEIILSFRGSEPKSLGDWLSDGNISRVKACGGRVHEGFWRDWQSIWGEVETVLQQWRKQEQRFLLTGHSMGGALAILAGMHLQMCGHGVDGIYTFGTPRVGDRAFALQFNRRLYKQTFRLVNDQDVVCHLPLLSMGYAHVGQLVYFNGDGKLEHYPGKDSDNFTLAEPFLDHDMAAYKRCIAANP
jgi:triacylglycerol lipase